MLRRAAAVFTLVSGVACGQVMHPRDNEIHDADTKAWWHTTEALSADDMEGRDTGSDGYSRAAMEVAFYFAAAGLKPAAEKGLFQDVDMQQVSVPAESASFVVKRDTGKDFSLTFLQEITVMPSSQSLSHASGKLVFRGYCGKSDMQDIEGRIVLCFGTQRGGLAGSAERITNVHRAGAKGMINVDDPYFSIEPPRWPYAYARSLSIVDNRLHAPTRVPKGAATQAEPPVLAPMLPTMRLSAQAFTKLLAGTGHNAAAILKAGGAKRTLEGFDLPATFTASIEQTVSEVSSSNILAVLPGSDPVLKDEYVVVSAHLDGYGYGTPVHGDNLYNGTLDDAAYVALLIQMATDIQSGKLPHPKRSILFAVFTGEEKGLLGSTWFTMEPTIPKEKLVADVNLDQLRPLFPLNILTAEAVNDTTLGETARAVGKPMGIEIREDREPERNLLRRADQYPFLRLGVPAISFIFGYDPGTDAEKRYREWYQVRYHRPQDDVTQPMDFDAATKFNTFFYRLVEAIADAAERPKILPGSQFAAK